MTTLMSSESRRRAGDAAASRLRLATVVAIGVSVVHYTDNYANYDAYPQGDALGLPPPPPGAVIASWLVFTLLAIAGLTALGRRRPRLGAALLVLYSVSGLVGIGHYLVEGATDMVWWRQAHVLADVGCGIAVAWFAARLLVRGR